MTNNHTSTKDREKTIDLPPFGPRNADPITDAPGAHPIETGVGAVIAGVASGLAVGTLTAGPLGAVAGAIAGGAIAGGLAGKGIGELIDPTSGDASPATEAQLAAQGRAYRYGQAAQGRFSGQMFAEVESSLRHGWEDSGETASWSDVKDAVRNGFDRTLDNFPEPL